MRTEEIAAKALEKVGNDRYILSILVAKRAREISDGSTILVSVDKTQMKPTDIAMLEIAQGKIALENISND